MCIYTYSGRSFFLYQWDKEPLSNRYISKHENMSLTETYLTNQTQIGLCPHKVELLLSHYIAMFYNSAINFSSILHIWSVNTYLFHGCNRFISKHNIMYHICHVMALLMSMSHQQTCPPWSINQQNQSSDMADSQYKSSCYMVFNIK